VSSPSLRVSDRVAAAAAEVLVGREEEKRRLAELLTTDAGIVVFVHGPGGIGKTVLVDGVLAATRRTSLVIDGRETEPTVPGILAALGRALDVPTLASTAEATAAIGAASVDVVVVDHLEQLNLLDGWLRNELAAGLPEHVKLVLVGRRGPNLAWRTSRGWRHLISELALGPMRGDDVQALLAKRGVDPQSAEAIVRWAHGHPLAVELGVEARRRQPGLEPPAGAPGDVVEELFAVLLDDLDDKERAVLEAATVLRRITRPGLAAVLGPDGDVEVAWQLLRGLPFTAVTPAGLELHGIARDVISEAVELRDPVGVRALRSRAAAALFSAVDGGPDWATTADLIHLVQNPLIRNAYLPPGGLQHPVERAEPEDREHLLDISAQWEGEVARRITERWWDLHPEFFSVVRGEDGTALAFSITAAVAAVDPALRREDPVVRTVEAHLRAAPMPEGRSAWLLRTTLSARTGEGRSPEIATMVVDLKRVYFEQRRSLRRVYAAVQEWGEVGPTLRVMGFDRLPAPVRVGDRSFTVAVLDLGSGGVSAWLAGHVQVETGQSTGPTPYGDRGREGTEEADDGSTRVVLHGLSPREREVLALLAEGLTNRQLAQTLFISERTANRHVSNIFSKLGVNNRTAAARWAVDAGLVG
jgi:DNA-binding CsgD family transcriptional regulator